MYRILLTDDENLIVDGLYDYLYSRRAEEYDLIRAYSAREALEILERIRVDIVVTDIEMPMTSGISLHETLRRKWPRAKTIFLTAHDKFDYLYYSSKLPNTKFILKSEGFGALLRLLDETGQEISRELFTRRLTSQENEKSQVETIFAQASLMRGLIGEELEGDEGLQKRLDSWRVPLFAKLPLSPVLLRQLSGNTQSNMLSLTGYLQEQFSRETTIYPICLEPDSLLLLFQQEKENGRRYISETCELIQKSLEELLSSKLIIAVTKEPVLWTELKSTVRDLQQTAEYYAAMEESILCTAGVQNAAPLLRQEAAGDLSELAVQRIDLFIEEHFRENVSLSDIAGHVYLSSSYVSHIYKKLRGMNVIDKLQQVRIQKSQELLTETNMKIQDVSEQSGFRSSRYFISVFRKNTGSNPGKYRKEHSKL